jgi:hypothetical protein
MKVRIPVVATLVLATLAIPAQQASASSNVSFVPCSQQTTTNCYTLTVNGNPAPADLLAVVALNTDDQSNTEAEIHLYDKTGVSGNSTYTGWDDAPRDQDGANGGRLDLSALVGPNDVIAITFVHSASLIPQWSMVNGLDVDVQYSLDNGTLTTTLSGKSAVVALPDPAVKRNWDDPSTDYTGKCGHVGTYDVVCDVQRATASALTFFARFRTFVDPNAFGFPGLWISTNATWYQFPRLGADRRSLVVPTGAPHELPDGTLNVGITRAYLPSSLFTSFGVEFTQDKVRELLRVSQEKEGVVTELPVTLTFDASGVQVDLPELTFSAPVLTFGATTTPSLPATGSSPLIVIYALLSTLSGVALVATRRRRVS